MKERLLLDRVALNAADVAPRHAQCSALVEPHLAHTEPAGRDGSRDRTRNSAPTTVGQLVQLPLAGSRR